MKRGAWWCLVASGIVALAACRPPVGEPAAADAAVADAGVDRDCTAAGAGATRCLGNISEQCVAGVWKPQADCVRNGATCLVLGGQATCRCPVGTVANTRGRCVDASQPGASCLRALPLDLEAGEIHGSTTSLGDEYQGSCNQPGSEDVVYAFTVATPRHLAFAVSGFDTTIYLRSGCDAASAELACNDDTDGIGSRIEVALEPGSYFLFVDGYGNASGVDGGNFVLRVTPLCPVGLVADPIGDGCIVDPCQPNPCRAPNQGRCLPTAATEQRCQCNAGYRLEGSSGCQPDPAAADWALLMYFNGDNDLEDSAYIDLGEMQSVGSSARLSIVMQLDSAYRDQGDARRLYVGAGTSQVIENLGEVNSGDWRTLADFGVWAVERYPARRYGLVMWDHGEGWKSRPVRPRSKGFSFDDTDGGEISIAAGDYGRALAAISAAIGGPLDLIGFDACLMGTWEVAAASAPYGQVFVASEESEPYSGWAFDDFLSPLAEAPSMTAQHLAEWIVDSYADASPDDSTMSAIDLLTLDALADALSALADALRDHPDFFAAVEQVRQQTANVEYDDTTRDLGDFAERIAVAGAVPADVAAAAQAVTEQLGRSVIHNRVHSGYRDFSGLTIYFPAQGSRVDPDYRAAGAVWIALSTWDEFLDAFTR